MMTFITLMKTQIHTIDFVLIITNPTTLKVRYPGISNRTILEMMNEEFPFGTGPVTTITTLTGICMEKLVPVVNGRSTLVWTRMPTKTDYTPYNPFHHDYLVASCDDKC